MIKIKIKKKTWSRKRIGTTLPRGSLVNTEFIFTSAGENSEAEEAPNPFGEFRGVALTNMVKKALGESLGHRGQAHDQIQKVSDLQKSLSLSLSLSLYFGQKEGGFRSFGEEPMFAIFGSLLEDTCLTSAKIFDQMRKE